MIAEILGWFFGLFKSPASAPVPASPVTGSTKSGSLRNVLLAGMKQRGQDTYGNGAFGASRDGGTRAHDGVDYVARDGDLVVSPMDGTLTRTMQIYKDDTRYRGIEVQSVSGKHVVKIFYVSVHGKVPRQVKAGESLGFVQNLSAKYAGITNHIHVELRVNGQLENPASWFK